MEAVAGAHHRFDRFFFYCYRYYPSYHGLPRVRDRAILVPTAEEDPAIGLDIFKPFFRSPRGIVYLTPEEQALVEDASGNREVPSVVIGSGLNMADPPSGLDFRVRHGLKHPFLLYVGRVDKNKGCITLLAYFRKFLEETGADVDLVLAGKAVIPVPDHPRIRHLGFVSEEEKVAALRQCRLLVMPSPYESLSIVTLEAWKLGVPVLANARCRVLMGQCLRSNGGLFYHGYAEFAEGLKILLEQPEVGQRLGRAGAGLRGRRVFLGARGGQGGRPAGANGRRVSALLLGLALAAQEPSGVDAATASRFAALALSCVHKEYPNKIAHVLQGDADVKPPRELTPAFYGCYDWHSAVHGVWLLTRLARLYPTQPLAREARQALAQSLTPQNISREVSYLDGPGRASFERPYGLAWLLQLAAELRSWPDADARAWSAALEPLERAAVRRLAEWLPKLRYPIRVGEHDQTAFAFGLVWDWARVAKDTAMTTLLESRIRDFYLADRGCPLTYEPSGQDFLSPCLAEADLVRRVLPPERFAAWLTDFLPGIPRVGETTWLPPGEVTDRADPKLAHLDGLNLSRAWMLEGIVRGLPPKDPRRASLAAAARAHRDAALPAVTGQHYEGGHWLGTFAVYLVTAAGGGLHE